MLILLLLNNNVGVLMKPIPAIGEHLGQPEVNSFSFYSILLLSR